MDKFILTRPTSEYASQIVEYRQDRQDFLDAGDSMDGTGSLRRIENPEELSPCYTILSIHEPNENEDLKRFWITL